jgi:thiamine kinase-like enzyme
MTEHDFLTLLREHGISAELTNTAMRILARLGLLETAKKVTVLNKGMTNQLFVLECETGRYILRIPGEGTEYIVNRAHETAVYEALKGMHITEDVLYINGENGIKITRFVEDAHNCDPANEEEVTRCIRHLKKLHDRKLSVPHTFDIFVEIQQYERRCGVGIGEYDDSLETRSHVMNLRHLLAGCDKVWGLSHIDPVYDNFLVRDDGICLIDWEYSGMCDVHVDLAMFCIYAEYTKEQTDWIIDLYFGADATDEIRMKIYAYMSSCAYLWTLWCEIKKLEGVEYPEYEDGQYRLAKEFYDHAVQLHRELVKKGS